MIEQGCGKAERFATKTFTCMSLGTAFPKMPYGKTDKNIPLKG